MPLWLIFIALLFDLLIAVLSVTPLLLLPLTSIPWPLSYHHHPHYLTQRERERCLCPRMGVVRGGGEGRGLLPLQWGSWGEEGADFSFLCPFLSFLLSYFSSFLLSPSSSSPGWMGAHCNQYQATVLGVTTSLKCVLFVNLPLSFTDCGNGTC